MSLITRFTRRLHIWIKATPAHKVISTALAGKTSVLAIMFATYDAVSVKLEGDHTEITVRQKTEKTINETISQENG